MAKLRICKKCSIEKPIEEFHRFSANYERHRYECKPCLKKRTRLWADTKTYRAHKKDKCEQCGFIPIHRCQLDVDHIDGNHKNNEVSNLRTLCANCHRLKTYINKEGRGRY